MLDVESVKLPSTDLVTISLFSLQKVENGVSNFNTFLYSQKENIKKISLKLADAARRNGQVTPKIVVSLLLIPDWNVSNNSYQDKTYLETKKRFFQSVEVEFAALVQELKHHGITIELEDFYQDGKLSEDEKKYMHQLKANGSNADVIKTRAIINNPNCKHLQIDSNTIIRDYHSLYSNTFALPDAIQRDALNANLYAPAHISANNKIVYIAPNSLIAPVLEHAYMEYMRSNFDNDQDKLDDSNAIYERIFAPALAKVGLTYENIEISKHKQFFPASLSKPEYRITADVVTAINMAWAKPKNIILDIDIFKKIAPIVHMDADFDYQSFIYILKKYSSYLSRNIKGGEDPAQYYESFLKLSDNETDITILRKFYLDVIANDSQKLKDAIRKSFPQEEAERMLSDPEYIRKLQVSFARNFPDTEKGNALTQNLFGCSVKMLHNNPTDIDVGKKCDIQKDVVDKLISIDNLIVKTETKRASGILSEMLATRILDAISKEHVLDISSKAQILLFMITLEAGSDLEPRIKNLDKVPTKIRNIFLNEIYWVLKNSNNIKGHFNYIKNRDDALDKVEAAMQNKYSQKRAMPVLTTSKKKSKNEEIEIKNQTSRRGKSKKHEP